MKQKAIFLDRDGTINIDHGYVHQVMQFQFIDGIVETLKILQNQGYLLIVVTNQSGIARGYFTEQQFLQLTKWMNSVLLAQGVRLSHLYYCPHHPEGINTFAQQCDCRKPKSGMLKQAIKEFNIDAENSIIVGDKWEDMQAGIGANIKLKVLVKTGKAVTTQATQSADIVLASLNELPNYLYQHKL